MIEINHLTKTFDGVNILNDITTSFRPGITNMIIGKSGSGKTVLLKCLIGLLEPTDGEILYNGRNVVKMKQKEKKLLRREMGVLFQGSALFDSMTVFDNVMFPLNMFSTLTKKEREDRVAFCLERVDLSHAGALFPSEISGGMMKRAAIARAIALEPKYLFCDEPNSGLDPKSSQLIDLLIDDITHELNITTVVVSHDMNSIMNIGDNVIFINEGIKEWEGSSEGIVKSNNKALNDFVFASNMFRKERELDK